MPSQIEMLVAFSKVFQTDLTSTTIERKFSFWQNYHHTYGYNVWESVFIHAKTILHIILLPRDNNDWLQMWDHNLWSGRFSSSLPYLSLTSPDCFHINSHQLSGSKRFISTSMFNLLHLHQSPPPPQPPPPRLFTYPLSNSFLFSSFSKANNKPTITCPSLRFSWRESALEKVRDERAHKRPYGNISNGKKDGRTKKSICAR